MTDSTRFMEWFTGSRVVDDRQRPQVVFHSTTWGERHSLHPFMHFGTLQAATRRLAINSGLRFHDEESAPLSASSGAMPGDVYHEDDYLDLMGGHPPWAKSFPRSVTGVWYHDTLRKRFAGDQEAFPWCVPGSMVVPVYLAIRNPITIRDDRTERGWVREVAVALGDAGKPILKDIDRWVEDRTGLAPGEAEVLDVLRAEAKAAGIDGCVYRNADEDPNSVSWIVFEPDAICPLLSPNAPRLPEPILWPGLSHPLSASGEELENEELEDESAPAP